MVACTDIILTTVSSRSGRGLLRNGSPNSGDSVSKDEARRQAGEEFETVFLAVPGSCVDRNSLRAPPGCGQGEGAVGYGPEDSVIAYGLALGLEVGAAPGSRRRRWLRG
jgi:hypothetical protein